MMPKFLPISVVLATISCVLPACSSSRTKDTAEGGADTGSGSNSKGGAAASGASGTGMSGGTSAGSGGSGTGGSAGSGGSGTGGAIGGSPATIRGCDGACQKFLGAMCPGVTTTQAECVTDCSDGSPVCSSELSTYMTCLAERGTFTCGVEGPEASGCGVESAPLAVCTACDITVEDGACYGCTKRSCCSDLKAYSGATDVVGFEACVTGCTTQACADGCLTRFPNAGKAYDSTLGCQEISCAEPCLCEASSDDSTCLSCIKINCCSSFANYSLAADVAAFDACAANCLDQACQDGCAAASPIAGAAFNTLVNCLEVSCFNACSAP